MAHGQQAMVHPELMISSTNSYVISDRTVSSATASPSILCVVCGDQAAGKYFGALICEACKSFFIRSTKKGEPQFKCSNNRLCTITPTSRLLCQCCRYQKCLEVGMCRKVKQNCKEPANDQILCKVCNDVSSGIHFGVYTCEGCKGFYRRSLRDSSNYTCVDNKQCSITPTTRNVCRYCRFQKCLEVGMSRSGIKLGRHQKYDTNLYTGSRDLQPGVVSNVSVIKKGRTIPVPRLESYSQEDADDLEIYLGDTFLVDLPGFGNYYGEYTSQPYSIYDNDLSVFNTLSDPIPLHHQDMYNRNYPSKRCGGTQMAPILGGLNSGDFHNQVMPCQSSQSYLGELASHTQNRANGYISLENSPSTMRKTLNHRAVHSSTPPPSLQNSHQNSTIPYSSQPEQVSLTTSTAYYDPFDPAYLICEKRVKENSGDNQVVPSGCENELRKGLEKGQSSFDDVVPTAVPPHKLATNKILKEEYTPSTTFANNTTSFYKQKSIKKDIDSSPESYTSHDSPGSKQEYEVEVEKNCAYISFIRLRLHGSKKTDEILSPGMEEMRKQRLLKLDALSMDTDMFDVSKAFEDLSITFENLEKSPEHRKATQILSQFVGKPDPTRHEWKLFQQRLSKMIASSIIFAKKIPGFKNIEVSDKMVLIKSCTFLMILTQLSWKNDAKFDWFVDTFLTVDTLRVFTAGMEAETRKFREDIGNAKLDSIETALMMVLVVLNPDIPNLVNPIIVLDLHSRFKEILKKYCTEKSQNLDSYYRILRFVPYLYNVEIIHKECVRSGHVLMPDVQLPALFAEINLS
ncbi:uncharacterized protein [Antedon mediterranea]|uniref:uncharacterized protein n=1 Tax=Antedon mediterranea TaxID=105859 RepID=UPI003AF7725E